MGSANSKVDSNQALSLCKARKKFIKRAIESRYLLAAAHLTYTQSLRNIGIALRRYAEAEILIESSLSTSTTELEKSPSHSSYLSPSPSHIVDVSDSPSPPVARLSYMTYRHIDPVTVSLNPITETSKFVDDGNAALSVLPPPPPPPPHESGASWDFFDPTDEGESFRFAGPCGVDLGLNDLSGWSHLTRGNSNCSEFYFNDQLHGEVSRDLGSNNGRAAAMEDTNAAANESKNGDTESKDSKKEKPATRREVCADREDPSEFITHRAKDFLSSIKDIEHKFFRASESGKELSRMLEADNIRFGFSEAKGT